MLLDFQEPVYMDNCAQFIWIRTESPDVASHGLQCLNRIRWQTERNTFISKINLPIASVQRKFPGNNNTTRDHERSIATLVNKCFRSSLLSAGVVSGLEIFLYPSPAAAIIDP